MMKYATETGTFRYTERFKYLAPGHFRLRHHLWLSSVGIGTHLGNTDTATSAGYVEAIKTAVLSGCNVIDTSINYRHMQSERDINRALRQLFTAGQAQRDELLVCTKGGSIVYDGEPPADPITYLQEHFYSTGLVQPEDIVNHSHCIAPGYLRTQVDISLKNLGLESIDVYYLHNPEMQLMFVTSQELISRIRRAFAYLEEEVVAGRIRHYGIATWRGLRVDTNAQDYLSLPMLVNLAREIGGENHHFRFIQVPFNVGMLEAYTRSNQSFERQHGNGEHESVASSLLEAAQHYGLICIGSAGLLQARLLGKLPHIMKQILGDLQTDILKVLGDLQTDTPYALQFNRSVPGLTTTLVGMSNPDHARENLVVARISPMPPNFFESF
jgi:aryl-alcohol dehydrogenase-like predicted oxidoreductase